MNFSKEAVIVREQHTLAQGIGGAFRDRLIAAQKAPFLFARFRWCSLFVVGFAVNLAVLCPQTRV
jgi:hypothetical protein